MFVAGPVTFCAIIFLLLSPPWVVILPIDDACFLLLVVVVGRTWVLTLVMEICDVALGAFVTTCAAEVDALAVGGSDRAFDRAGSSWLNQRPVLMSTP